MSKRFILTVIMAIVIFGAAGIAMVLAKGYTFSTSDNRLVGTGIISATSEPDSASVYIDGHLTTATNATISSLPPKTYNVKIVKEGYIPWENNVKVKEGLVTEVKVTLFPAFPTIYALTYNGIKNPVLSPDGSKMVFTVISGKKPGLWVWSMVKNQPINFIRASEPHQVAANSTGIDFSNSTYQWSPDSQQIIATVGNNSYLLDSERLSTDPKDITPTLDATLNSWAEDIKVKNNANLMTIKDLGIRKIASESAALKWSPDGTKFIFGDLAKTIQTPTKNIQTTQTILPNQSFNQHILNAKVYDIETNKTYDLPDAKLQFWLPNSMHVVMVEDGDIAIVDADGTNKAVIYAGNFLDDFVFPWPDSSRLVFITTFPTPTASEPNLYGVNLK